MDENLILPVFNSDKGIIVDGYFIKSSPFCRKGNEKCNSYYSRIEDITGTHTCPYGFTSNVVNYEGVKLIFTAFRQLGEFNKKKTQPKISSECHNPVMTKEQIDSMIQSTLTQIRLRNENIDLKDFTRDVVHEVKNFNAQVISKAETLMNKLNDNKNRDMQSLGKSILLLSMLISERFSAYDITFNPDSIKIGRTYPINIHGKFQKIKFMYDTESRKKGIDIRLSGSSNATINAYPAFDLLPFLILDNAIKYSPIGEKIYIEFNQTMHLLEVKIKSIGPSVEESELTRIFEKKYRTESACKAAVTGTGIGLFLAKTICDVHKCDIRASFQGNGRRIDGVSYGEFCVRLRFPLN